MGIPMGRFDLKDAIANLQDGDIKGPSPQIEYSNEAFCFLIQSIGKRCGRRFVDDPQNIQSSDFACILGGLSLAVIEIGGYGYHHIGNLLTQMFFGGLLYVGQDIGRDFSRAVMLSPQADTHIPILSLFNFIG